MVEDGRANVGKDGIQEWLTQILLLSWQHWGWWGGRHRHIILEFFQGNLTLLQGLQGTPLRRVSQNVQKALHLTQVLFSVFILVDLVDHATQGLNVLRKLLQLVQVLLLFGLAGACWAHDGAGVHRGV
jgi:hypothetical protein